MSSCPFTTRASYHLASSQRTLTWEPDCQPRLRSLERRAIAPGGQRLLVHVLVHARCRGCDHRPARRDHRHATAARREADVVSDRERVLGLEGAADRPGSGKRYGGRGGTEGRMRGGEPTAVGGGGRVESSPGIDRREEGYDHREEGHEWVRQRGRRRGRQARERYLQYQQV